MQRADVLGAAEVRPLGEVEDEARVGAEAHHVGEQADERGEREGGREEDDVADLDEQRDVLWDDAREACRSEWRRGADGVRDLSLIHI